MSEDKPLGQLITEAVSSAVDRNIDRLTNLQLDRERFLTIPETAKIAAVSRPTVRGWIARDFFPLPAYRVGRDFKIKLREFEEWFEQYRFVRESKVQRLAEYRRAQ
jgi:excisionase family DNA binding protein